MSVRKSSDFIADIERQFVWYVLNVEPDPDHELGSQPFTSLKSIL